MNQFFKIIILLYLTNSVVGQDWRYDQFIPKFNQQILSDSNVKNERESRILRDLSFAGAYNELYRRDAYTDKKLEAHVQQILESHTTRNAKSYILSKSQNEQILIVNESHHRPEHRKFTSDLLDGLYDQGYRYLALEAILSNQHSNFTHYPSNKYNLGDTTIMTRGYPLMKSCSGTYVKEPAFGSMIRKAIKIGYTIIGYEKNGKMRELYQAQNIAKIVKANPSAKIIIHCGYGHLIESPRKRKSGEIDTLMAGHIKNITGINPFTIDQTSYYNLQNISSYVGLRSGNVHPQIFLKNDKVFRHHKTECQDFWDLTVFHPNYGFDKGRPRWLTTDSKLNDYLIDLDKVCIKFPIRIKLLNVNDQLDAVPLDIIEVDEHGEKIYLFGDIEKGKIVVENSIGDRQIIEVEKKSYD